MKGRTYDLYFPDSNEHTEYTVIIYSENDEELEVKHVDDHTVQEVVDLIA